MRTFVTAFQSLGGLTNALVVLFGVFVLGAAVDAMMHARLASRWDDVTDNGRITGTFSELLDLSDLEDQANGVRGGLILLGIGTGIVFIVWLFRARRNIEAWGASGSLAPGWAIGAWFIPCANWVLPAIVVNDVWRGSQPTTRPRRSAAVVGIWWGTWMAMGIAQLVRTSSEPDPDTIAFTDTAIADLVDDYARARTWSILAALLVATSAVLAIVVVRAVRRMQEERNAEHRAALGGFSAAG
jgi:hypothetical protein